MIENVIVMPGPALFDLRAVHAVARTFGWAVQLADDLNDVTAAQSSQRTTALLFHCGAFGACSWLESVRLLRSVLPEVRAIACHGFSEAVDWPTLCAAGAFHSLWLPLKENEVRQSFGFIAEAEKRRARPAERLPLMMPARKLSVAQRSTPNLPHGAAAGVMVSAAG